MSAPLRQRRWWSGLLLPLLLIHLGNLPATAQSATISILVVQEDAGAGELIVRGPSFPTTPRVFFLVDPVAELHLVSASPTLIRAKLPAQVPLGTFYVIVLDPVTARYGLFSTTLRTAGAGNALVDANGRFIGSFDAAPGSVTMKTTDRLVVLDVVPEGFKIGGYSVSLRHFDASCSSPHVIEPTDAPALRFTNPFSLTTADGSEPNQPPFGTVLWVPNRATTPVVSACIPTEVDYYRERNGQCQSTPRVCGYKYWPATRIDLSHFVPPFRVQ